MVMLVPHFRESVRLRGAPAPLSRTRCTRYRLCLLRGLSTSQGCMSRPYRAEALAVVGELMGYAAELGCRVDLVPSWARSCAAIHSMTELRRKTKRRPM